MYSEGVVTWEEDAHPLKHGRNSFAQAERKRDREAKQKGKREDFVTRKKGSYVRTGGGEKERKANGARP